MQTLQRHPKHEVFGLLDQPQEVDAILQDVGRLGGDERSVQVIRKEEPADTAEQHVGVIGRTVDRLSEEHEFNELYESHVEAGQCLVGIPCSDQIDKEKAQRILHDHGAHDINYFGQWVVEELPD
jgi:hypothetical protein